MHVVKFTQQEPPRQDPLLQWKQGAQTPVDITSHWGTAMVHRGTVYVSKNRRMFAFSISEDKWTELKSSQYEDFCMAVVHDKLTAIGGSSKGVATNSLLCLSESTSGTTWEELLLPMLTKRIRAAAVTTRNHLVVAGGRSVVALHSGVLFSVETLNLDSLLNQWSYASSLPQALQYPRMILCGDHLYLSENSTIFSCSVEELLESCKPASTTCSDIDYGPVWTKLANIPVRYDSSLTTLKGQVLAVGGSHQYGGTPTGAILRYSRVDNFWNVIGEIPIPRYATVIPCNELIVMGGEDERGRYYNITEIASTH